MTKTKEIAARRAVSAAKRSAGLAMPCGIHRHSHHIEALKQLELIPEDSRSVTARLFGDPLPGRSALDRRMIG